MLNGIAASSDGNTLYVVYSGENKIKMIDVKSSEILLSTTVPAADNIKWSSERNTLVAASFDRSESSDAFSRCVSSAIEICPVRFSIVELNPNTLAKQTIFENQDAPMGAGTVGLKLGSTLFIGTFSGNRILEVNLAETDNFDK